MSDVKLERNQELDENKYRKVLPGTGLEYFDACEAVEAISPGSLQNLALYVESISRAISKTL